MAITRAAALSRATGISPALFPAHPGPFEHATLAPPTTPDWGLALGISAAGFAARAFTCERESLESVRRFARDVVHDWELDALADDMTTVVGELTANAVRHALDGQREHSAKAWLGMARTGGALICTVADPSPAPPSPRQPHPLAETGWGLLIVNALTSQWGYSEPDPTGKTVWARIATPGL
ncbi:ATP-binding protein [Streptomyces sp. NPDC046862]|uniref:ATP-binding protein n=1 Tax=Streptomyces sp. NPDC046862 TaxID=3154603 RepID=UPI003455AAA9